MNLLLVNPVHPSTPHISAVRAWRFALALSAIGHRVVLLTATPADADAPAIPPLASHDWRTPLVVAPCGFDIDMGTAPAAGHPLVRRLRTAWQLLRHGGYQSLWADAAVATAERLADSFRPDAIWATYGKMEAVFVAKRLSGALGVPWVLDLKDNWELFVPAALRRIMAHRTRGWRAITANAAFTDLQARHWHGAVARIVYSGVDEAFFAPAEDLSRNPPAGQEFVINLIGSLYYRDRLQVLLCGIAEWSRQLPASDRQRVRLGYLGGDIDMFQRSIGEAGLDIHSRAEGYLPIERMAAAGRNAAVNLYVTHDGSFHHKLLELLACDRPVLVYPPESAESHVLVAQVRGELIEPADAAGVAGALGALHRRWREGAGRRIAAPGATAAPNPCERYSWNSQAHLLEEVLADAARP